MRRKKEQALADDPMAYAQLRDGAPCGSGGWGAKSVHLYNVHPSQSLNVKVEKRWMYNGQYFTDTLWHTLSSGSNVKLGCPIPGPTAQKFEYFIVKAFYSASVFEKEFKINSFSVQDKQTHEVIQGINGHNLVVIFFYDNTQLPPDEIQTSDPDWVSLALYRNTKEFTSYLNMFNTQAGRLWVRGLQAGQAPAEIIFYTQ